MCIAAVHIGQHAAGEAQLRNLVIRVSSGNFLEMYDFMVFAYYAAAIGTVFFPSGSPLRYNGAMVVFLTEIMPVEVRTSGFALAYSLATAIFGGFTPLISTYLMHATHNQAFPGLWLSAAAFIGLSGVFFARSSQPYGAV